MAAKVEKSRNIRALFDIIHCSVQEYGMPSIRKGAECYCEKGDAAP